MENKKEATNSAIALAHRARLCAHFGAHHRAEAHAIAALEDLWYLPELFEGMTEATARRFRRYLAGFVRRDKLGPFFAARDLAQLGE